MTLKEYILTRMIPHINELKKFKVKVEINGIINDASVENLNEFTLSTNQNDTIICCRIRQRIKRIGLGINFINADLKYTKDNSNFKEMIDYLDRKYRIFKINEFLK